MDTTLTIGSVIRLNQKVILGGPISLVILLYQFSVSERMTTKTYGLSSIARDAYSRIYTPPKSLSITCVDRTFFIS